MYRVFWRERQGIAQKGVRAIDAGKPLLEMAQKAAKQCPCSQAVNEPMRTLEGPTRKPRHASVARAPTRKRSPHSTVYECLKAFFRHARVFKRHRHAVYHCLKEVQKPFRHASVFKTLGVATPAEPRGEKKTFFCANFGR